MNEQTRIPVQINQPGRPGSAPHEDMVWIPGGTFLMGSDDHYPEEGPTHYVTVSGFWMDKYTVTNTQFQRFVEETDYVTVAERQPNREDYPGALPELLVPGSAVFVKPAHRVDLRNPGNWWTYVPGANWQNPEGPRSSLKGRWNHPVVHIAFEDADAYAAWAGKSLPTEAQWGMCCARGIGGRSLYLGQ